jgi:hypothetical protein
VTRGLPDVVDQEMPEASNYASGDDLMALSEAMAACFILDDTFEIERRYPLTLSPRKRGAEDEARSSKHRRQRIDGREKTTKVHPQRHSHKSFRSIREGGNYIGSSTVEDLHDFNWATITHQTNALELRSSGEVQAPSISEVQAKDAACQTDALQLRSSGEAQLSISEVQMKRVEYIDAACQTDAPELRSSRESQQPKLKHDEWWQTGASNTSTNTPNKVCQVESPVSDVSRNRTSTVKIGDGPEQPSTRDSSTQTVRAKKTRTAKKHSLPPIEEPTRAGTHEEQQQKESAESTVADVVQTTSDGTTLTAAGLELTTKETSHDGFFELLSCIKELLWELLIDMILFLVFLFLLGLFLRERQLHYELARMRSHSYDCVMY